MRGLRLSRPSRGICRGRLTTCVAIYKGCPILSPESGASSGRDVPITGTSISSGGRVSGAANRGREETGRVGRSLAVPRIFVCRGTLGRGVAALGGVARRSSRGRPSGKRGGHGRGGRLDEAVTGVLPLACRERTGSRVSGRAAIPRGDRSMRSPVGGRVKTAICRVFLPFASLSMSGCGGVRCRATRQGVLNFVT